MAFRQVKLTVAPTGLHSNLQFDGQGIGARRFALETDYDGLSTLTIECVAGLHNPEPLVLEGYFVGFDELSEAGIKDLCRRLRDRLPKPE